MLCLIMILIYFVFETEKSYSFDNINWISDFFEENHFKNTVFVSIRGHPDTKSEGIHIYKHLP